MNYQSRLLPTCSALLQTNFVQSVDILYTNFNVFNNSFMFLYML
jgi:hypothetical protein